MFRGSERIRLIAMLGTLCILGMIVFRSYISETKKPPENDRELEQPRPAEKQEPAPSEQPEKKETFTPGSTDEDSEEIAAAKDEFQALTDGTLGIQPEEMFAYRRLFDWVEHQSFAALKKRAKKNVPLDDLMRSPGKFRGTLVQIDLNVRQIIPFEDPSLSSQKLYELRGFSEDSGAWLYFVIVPSLPDGMPIGSQVEEQVRVEGYFLKLQGYLEAGAKPRAAALKAPLVIGRIKKFTSSSEKTPPANNDWLYLAAGGFVLLSLIFTAGNFFARRRAKRRQAQLEEYKIQRAKPWLDQEKSSKRRQIDPAGRLAER